MATLVRDNSLLHFPLLKNIFHQAKEVILSQALVPTSNAVFINAIIPLLCSVTFFINALYECRSMKSVKRNLVFLHLHVDPKVSNLYLYLVISRPYAA